MDRSSNSDDTDSLGAAFDIATVLVPVDGSDESMRAVEYAVAIAERYDASVHALYVLDEEASRQAAFGENEAEITPTSERFMDTARDLAADVSFTHSSAYGFSPTMKTRHPGSVVLDAAEDAGVDFIVIPHEPVSGEPEEPLERTAEYVLQYASQPVLSV